jgi:hypothetical protein
MGPSRKKARTKPPSVEEPAAANPPAADSTSSKPSTEADNHNDVVDKEGDLSTPLKAVKPELGSSKKVSLLTRESPNEQDDA